MTNGVYQTAKSQLHLAILKAKRYSEEIFRWGDGVRDKSSIRVFYGHNHIPGRGEKAGGGIIKFQDLGEHYPNTPKDANILYLVSSALPHFAPIMVRLAKRKGVRFVWNQNGVAYPAWCESGWEELNREMKALIHMADYVVYQSEFCKMSADRFLGRYNGPSEILNNPIDTSNFIPSASIPKGKHILLAGSHEHFYRVKCALDMIVHLRQAIPDIKLTVAGRYSWRSNSSDAKREAKKYARQIGVGNNVIFKGSYTQEEVVALMQSAHILVHTKYNDPCPRLVCEAMACGVPVVFSASGGMVELVGDTGGVGVDAPLDWERDHPPNPTQLSNAAGKVFSKYAVYRKGARERAVSKLDNRYWIEQHHRIFKQLLTK